MVVTWYSTELPVSLRFVQATGDRCTKGCDRGKGNTGPVMSQRCAGSEPSRCPRSVSTWRCDDSIRLRQLQASHFPSSPGPNLGFTPTGSRWAQAPSPVAATTIKGATEINVSTSRRGRPGHDWRAPTLGGSVAGRTDGQICAVQVRRRLVDWGFFLDRLSLAVPNRSCLGKVWRSSLCFRTNAEQRFDAPRDRDARRPSSKVKKAAAD